MIKPEKTRKIPENSGKKQKIFPKNPKFPRKIPKKNPKNLPDCFARRLGGLPAAKLGEGIFQKKFLRGVFWLYPLGHVCY